MIDNLTLFNDYAKTNLNEFLDYVSLPENEGRSFELVDGQIVGMAGNTSWNHQAIGGFIARKIGNYLAYSPCEVATDINVYFFNESLGKCKNIFQPDIIVGCDRSKMTEKGYEGTPEFIVEVVSKSTAKNDYHTKCRTYMEFGVKEYWIVDHLKSRILVYKRGNPTSVDIYTFSDVVKVGIFDDLHIDFSELVKILP